MKPSRDISRLVEIMSALREPESGCPWDLEQDFKSILPHTIEEAYEVADAIERDDMDDLRLELGDLLLQPVYHAQMAAEAGHFDFGDVVEGITAKMIRRHPHVFGTEDVSASEFTAANLAKETWEKIKAAEKQEARERRAQLGLPPKETDEGLLDDVPLTLPALTQAIKLQKKASKVGFDWNDPQAVFDKIEEETGELREEIKKADREEADNSEKIGEELGDLLFVIVNLARHLGVDPEAALAGTNRKFRDRFSYIEKNIPTTGKSIEGASLEEMEDLWQEAKGAENP